MQRLLTAEQHWLVSAVPSLPVGMRMLMLLL